MKETVEAYHDLIVQHAHIALKKVRKPSEYDLEDFIQEGNTMLATIQNRGMYHPEKGSSFKTFFTLLLRQHFGGLVSKSYHRHSHMPHNVCATLVRPRYASITSSHNAFDIVAMRDTLEDFTPEELEYTQTVFLFVDRPVKFRRKLIREKLNISHDRERELRRSIHDKILK